MAWRFTKFFNWNVPLAADDTDSLREDADLYGFFISHRDTQRLHGGSQSFLIGARFDYAQRDKRET